MTARDAKELAERAGVPADFVDRLVQLGILVAAEDGTFSDVWDPVERRTHRGDVSFDAHQTERRGHGSV